MRSLTFLWVAIVLKKVISYFCMYFKLLFFELMLVKNFAILNCFYAWPIVKIKTVFLLRGKYKKFDLYMFSYITTCMKWLLGFFLWTIMKNINKLTRSQVIFVFLLLLKVSAWTYLFHKKQWSLLWSLFFSHTF